MRRIALLALGLTIANCQARTAGSSRSRNDGGGATRPIPREPDLQEAVASVPGQERDAGVTTKPDDGRVWGNAGHELSPEKLKRLTRMGRESDGDAAMELSGYYALYYFDRPALARRWLETAAKNGNPDAQFLLGEQMLDGVIRGGRRKAILWLRRAADAGQKDARELYRRDEWRGKSCHRQGDLEARLSTLRDGTCPGKVVTTSIPICKICDSIAYFAKARQQPGAGAENRG